MRDIAQAHIRRRHRPTVLLNLDSNITELPSLLELARESGWRLVDVRFRGGELPVHFKPQGAIVDLLPSHKRVKKLLKEGCAVVRIGSLPHPRDHAVPAVMPDWEAMGRLAADHFSERGFKHIGYVGRDPWSAKQSLYSGMEKRARQLGCACHLLRMKNDGFTNPAARYRHRREVFGRWLHELPRPIGLLGFVDGWAATLCAMCQDLEITVPEQVAVLGLGDIASASISSWPTLSSIVPDHDALAKTAVRMLDQLMQGGQLTDTTVMIPPSHIVVRESTDVLATPDLAVAAALRYIWTHHDLDISLDEVAEQAGMSRRTLTRRFRKALGRTVTEEFTRVRLEHVRRLLRESDDTIETIAQRAGFNSADYLHRAFKHAFGITPRQYRVDRGE